MKAEVGDTTLDQRAEPAVATTPDLHGAGRDEGPLHSSTVALSTRDLFELHVGEPDLDCPVVDSDIAGRIVVIVVCGQFGRGVAEVDETIRNLSDEILLQPGERRSDWCRNCAPWRLAQDGAAAYRP
jgi:hypothetical protein